MMHFATPQDQIIGHHAMMKHKIPEFLLQAMPPSINPHGGNQQMAVAAAHAAAAAAAAAHGGNMMPSNEECGIRDVWRHNLEEEFHHIRQVVQKFPFVAMDTEFPGVVARPIGEFRSTADYHYHMLRCNVDLLRIIQLGLTFMDEEGKRPSGFSTWQFNFKFNLSEDMYAQDSIDLLQNSGIQFKKHEEEGIDPTDFAEMLMVSGIVLDDNIKWLCFHSGYDFGYLLKVLTDQNLPSEESEFFDLLRDYFPNIYDIKYLMKSCKNLKGGLQEVADQLEIRRLGPQHQAGSDALLTGMAFFKMREVYKHIDEFCMSWSSAYARCQFNTNIWQEFQYRQYSTMIALNSMLSMFQLLSTTTTSSSSSNEQLELPKVSICEHYPYHIPNHNEHSQVNEFQIFPDKTDFCTSFVLSNLSPNAEEFVPSQYNNNNNNNRFYYHNDVQELLYQVYENEENDSGDINNYAASFFVPAETTDDLYSRVKQSTILRPIAKTKQKFARLKKKHDEKYFAIIRSIMSFWNEN